MVGIEADGFGEMLACRGDISALGEDHAQVVVGLGVARVEVQRGPEGRLSPTPFTQLLQHDTEVVMCVGQARIEAHSLFQLSARFGLAPVGDPTIADSAVSMRGQSQADEIPYGLTLESHLNEQWSLKNEVAGMWGFLSSTTLDHYSVARVNVTRHFKKTHVTLNAEKGLTRESDEWVAGFYLQFDFGVD